MRYRIIANEETAKGFSLFGVESIAVSNKEHARATLEEALHDSSLGAVVLSKEVGEMLAEEVSLHTASCRLPQVLVLDV